MCLLSNGIGALSRSLQSNAFCKRVIAILTRRVAVYDMYELIINNNTSCRPV